MYEVRKRGKVMMLDGRYLFANYDEARHAVRRKLTKLRAKGKVIVPVGVLWDKISRGPTSINAFGYKIVRV